MRFASQEFFNHLKQELGNDSGDGRIYEEVCYLIESETKWKLARAISIKEDREDILQEIKIAVLTKLPDFILNSENLHEAQRQSWLNTIVERKISNWCRKPDNLSHDSLDRTSSDDGGEEYMPKELVEATSSMENEPESVHMDENISAALGSVLYDLFSLRTSPEKLVCFVYSRLLIPQMVQSRHSGKPTETERILRDVTLYEIYDNMIEDFQKLLCENIDPEVFKPLKEKLDQIQEDGQPVGSRQFNLTVKQIVDSTNRVNKKVQDMYNVYLERMEGEMNLEYRSRKLR